MRTLPETVAKFESSVIGRDDKKAVVYRSAVDSFEVSFYVNDAFVYSVPQSFDTLADACVCAQDFTNVNAE